MDVAVEDSPLVQPGVEGEDRAAERQPLRPTRSQLGGRRGYRDPREPFDSDVVPSAEIALGEEARGHPEPQVPEDRGLALEPPPGPRLALDLERRRDLAAPHLVDLGIVERLHAGDHPEALHLVSRYQRGEDGALPFRYEETESKSWERRGKAAARVASGSRPRARL